MTKEENPYNPITEPASYKWFNEKPKSEKGIIESENERLKAESDILKAKIIKIRCELLASTNLCNSFEVDRIFSKNKAHWNNDLGEEVKAEGEWISVETPPKENEQVLCYNGYRMIQNSWMQHTGSDLEWFKRTFTHWMPLPKPPKQ